MISGQEPPMEVKPTTFPTIIQCECLSVLHGQANLPCVLQPDNIPYAGKSLIVHIKAAFIKKHTPINTTINLLRL